VYRDRLLYIYIYIYCICIKKKHVERQISCRIYETMQKDKLAAEYMKPCIFVLLADEYYISMKLEMPSIVY
jgi:hypothetical protein